MKSTSKTDKWLAIYTMKFSVAITIREENSVRARQLSDAVFTEMASRMSLDVPIAKSSNPAVLSVETTPILTSEMVLTNLTKHKKGD